MSKENNNNELKVKNKNLKEKAQVDASASKKGNSLPTNKAHLKRSDSNISNVSTTSDSSVGSNDSIILEKHGEDYIVKDPPIICLNPAHHILKKKNGVFIHENKTVTTNGSNGEVGSRAESHYVSEEGYEKQNKLVTCAISLSMDKVYRRFMQKGSVPETEIWDKEERARLASKKIIGARNLEECTNTSRFVSEELRINGNPFYVPKENLQIRDVRSSLSIYRRENGEELPMKDGKFGDMPIKGLVTANLCALLLGETDMQPTNLMIKEDNGCLVICKIDNKHGAGTHNDGFFDQSDIDGILTVYESNEFPLGKPDNINLKKILEENMFCKKGHVTEGFGFLTAFNFPFAEGVCGDNFVDEFLKTIKAMSEAEKEIGDIFRDTFNELGVENAKNSAGENVCDKVANAIDARTKHIGNMYKEHFQKLHKEQEKPILGKHTRHLSEEKTPNNEGPTAPRSV